MDDTGTMGGRTKQKTAISRRRLLRRGALLGVVGAAGMLGYAWQIEPFWWRAIHRDLPIANLPDALCGKTLVQISDLHIGPYVDEDYIAGAVKAVGRFNADILVITGDIAHYAHDCDVDQVTRVMGGLQHGDLATIAIPGNHDYGAGWSNEAGARDVTRRMADLGIDVLRNDLRDVAGLQIAGLDDLWAHRFEPDRVLPRIDPDRASLVLCHNPDAADEPGWGEYRGWILSGHTHGGQCKPPFLPPPMLPVKNRRYTRGEIDLHDGRRLYINVGLGYLRQVRFNVRPEVTVFTLERAERA